MQAVGKLGSYISKSVYTVSGPFHPFGGAVDIIVVKQPDGTYKSSPWYVRFGKFQGVLKTREKIVGISVNGVEADFSMYLNHKGEAYFIREVDVIEENLPSECEKKGNRLPIESKSCDFDSDWSGVVRTDSMERAEIAADLLDLKWSTNLASSRSRKDNASRFSSSYKESESFVKENGVEKDTKSPDSVTMISGIENSGSEIQECVENAAYDVQSFICSETLEGDLLHGKGNLKNQFVLGESSVEEDLLFGNMDDYVLNEEEECFPVFSLDQSVINDYIDNSNIQTRTTLRTISSDACINKSDHVRPKEFTRMVRSLPNEWSLEDNLEARDLGRSFNPGGESTAEDVKIRKEGEEGPANSSVGNPPSLRPNRRSWPFSFKRSRSVKVFLTALDGSENNDSINTQKNTIDLEGEKELAEVKVNKTKVRTNTPTSEQLASLNLKEGKNIVIFTFSTAMLGKQQVDARVFLWRWDTQIVISDVDGTITRSDLLGQVMPLVGMDWSQIGVAHLFSAIKENGYQLLFLSARSIAQAFLTRKFLFNIKQDGKALPDGPVVISPDGLFPSLFREVVRRCPHEFKIACLEDIKALFPADKNPFYAGFGNRDTDEFSYLKVGIPRGKIFIINPKGEIAVNRRVDTRSYTSLHTLVHGMFPTMSSSEQEDFNSWNYWKLPPPIIDI